MKRSRADDRHAARDDVEELRKLVDPPAAEELPDPRDAGIVRNLEHARVDVAVHVQVRHVRLEVLGVRDHRAELEDVERADRCSIRTCRKNTGPLESSLIQTERR